MHRSLSPSIIPRRHEHTASHATNAKPIRRTTSKALFGTIALASSAGVALAQLTPVNLGTLGGNFSRAYDINDAGAVVGFSANPASPATTAFVWTASTGMTALPRVTSPVSINPSSATAINNSSEMAVIAAGAYKYSASTYTPLGLIHPLYTRMLPAAINNPGDIVGTAIFPDSAAETIGFIFRNGVLAAAGFLNEANDINDTGRVAGVGGRVSEAMVWDSVTGGTTRLGTLGGTRSYAYGINHQGDVVGFSGLPTGADNAFLWTQAGGLVALAMPGGGSSSFAHDINDAGEIVGSVRIAGSIRAAYWHHNTAIDLNTLLAPGSGWVLETATAINNSGCITGTGYYFGDERAYVLCIPSPGAASLFGLTTLAVLRRRRAPSAS